MRLSERGCLVLIFFACAVMTSQSAHAQTVIGLDGNTTRKSIQPGREGQLFGQGDHLVQIDEAVSSSDYPTKFFVPAVANLTGFGGTKWQTDIEVSVSLLTDGLYPVPFTMVLLPRGQDNPSPQEKTFIVNHSEILRFENVLGSVFGFEGAATLQFKGLNNVEQLVISARTYAEGPSGSYGMYMPALTSRDEIGTDKFGRMMQIKQSVSDTTGFRTNVGLVNPNPFPVDFILRLELYGQNENDEEVRSIVVITSTLGPLMSVQFDKVVSQSCNEVDFTGMAEVICTTEGGSVFAYATPIDNGTGDGFFVPATVLDIFRFPQ
ncbi:MAG: hypothetical protein GY906_18960 [bacterium]|nr:hypothetical protein [bacterium]